MLYKRRLEDSRFISIEEARARATSTEDILARLRDVIARGERRSRRRAARALLYLIQARK
jgi:hypothetical protein